jgi:hypothetical protein
VVDGGWWNGGRGGGLRWGVKRIGSERQLMDQRREHDGISQDFGSASGKSHYKPPFYWPVISCEPVLMRILSMFRSVC